MKTKKTNDAGLISGATNTKEENLNIKKTVPFSSFYFADLEERKINFMNKFCKLHTEEENES